MCGYSKKCSQIPASTILWLALCNIYIWNISMPWPEKFQLNPTLDLHRRAPHKGTPAIPRYTWTHNFFGADLCNLISLLHCVYFLPVMKIAQSGRKLLFILTISSFLPSRRCWCCLSAWSFILLSASYQSCCYFSLMKMVSPWLTVTERQKAKRWPCRSSRMRWDLVMKLYGWLRVCNLGRGSVL